MIAKPRIMKRFFSPSPFVIKEAIALARIIIGLFLVYHGFEVFFPDKMEAYMQWDMFKNPGAKFLVYAGKGSEFLAGVLLVLGLLTRLAAVIVIGTFFYITFFVGQGRFWYEEQHPFMFALFGMFFLLTGPGAWALDNKVFKQSGG